jgi:hypothetical protein
VFVVVLQMGFVPALQSVLAAHSTHLPIDVQAGFVASRERHSAEVEQARQAFELGSQIGRSATPHWALIPHSTHAPEEAQTGVAALHSVPVSQARHAFDVMSQTGAAPEHDAAVQGGTTSGSPWSVGASVGESIPPSTSGLASPPSVPAATHRPLPSGEGVRSQRWPDLQSPSPLQRPGFSSEQAAAARTRATAPMT